MNLHNAIMNIECSDQNANDEFCDRRSAYQFGHRDARHAAAELSLKAEARIEELESVLKGLLNEARTATKPLHPYSEWSSKAMEVLEGK